VVIILSQEVNALMGLLLVGLLLLLLFCFGGERRDLAQGNLRLTHFKGHISLHVRLSLLAGNV